MLRCFIPHRTHPSLVQSLTRDRGAGPRLAASALLLCLTCLSPLAAQEPPAAPPGMISFFALAECPTEWSKAEAATGRLVIGTVVADDVGKQVGEPLADREDRKHSHEYILTLAVPEKSIAAISGCCNGQGAKKGDYAVDGATLVASTELPFIQLTVCRKD